MQPSRPARHHRRPMRYSGRSTGRQMRWRPNTSRRATRRCRRRTDASGASARRRRWALWLEVVMGGSSWCTGSGVGGLSHAASANHAITGSSERHCAKFRFLLRFRKSKTRANHYQSFIPKLHNHLNFSLLQQTIRCHSKRMTRVSESSPSSTCVPNPIQKWPNSSTAVIVATCPTKQRNFVTALFRWH